MSDIYKRAANKKLRFATAVGNVAAEDLFDLTLKQLDEAASKLKKHLISASEETLFDKPQNNTDDQLAYDIVVDVFKSKQAAAESAKQGEITRQKNARIRELMADKMDEGLKEKSLAELEDLLESVD